MVDAPFDPSGAVVFDLPAGRVSLAHTPESVLAPAHGLAELCAAAGEDATRAFGRAMGTAMGQRVADRVPAEAMKELTLEGFTAQLRGEFALAGLGIVTLERWGDALLFLVEDAVVPSGLVAGVIEAALQSCTKREIHCVRLMTSTPRSRFLVTNAATVKRVRDWLGEEMPWAEIMVRLHVPSADDPARGEA